MIVATTRATEDEDEVNLLPRRKLKRGLKNLTKLKKRNGSCDDVDVDLNVNVTTSRITGSGRILSNAADIDFPESESDHISASAPPSEFDDYDDDEDPGISLTPSSSASDDLDPPETPTQTSIGISTEDLNFNENSVDMEDVLGHQGQRQGQGQEDQDTNANKREVEAPEDFLDFTEEEAEEILTGNVSDESFKFMLEEEFILPDIKAEDEDEEDNVDHLADNNLNNNDDLNLHEDLQDSKNVIQGDAVDDDEIVILEELPVKKRDSVIVTPPKMSKAPPHPPPASKLQTPQVPDVTMGGENDIEILDMEDPLQIPGDSDSTEEAEESQGQPLEPDVEVPDSVPSQEGQDQSQPPLQLPSDIKDLEENEPQPQEPEVEVPDTVPSQGQVQNQGQGDPQLQLPPDTNELEKNKDEKESESNPCQGQNEIHLEPDPDLEPEPAEKVNPNENLLWEDEFLDLIGPITDEIDPAELTVALDMVDQQRELEQEGVEVAAVDEVGVEANVTPPPPQSLEMDDGDDLNLDTEEKENVPPAPVPAQILPLPLDPNAEPTRIKRVETTKVEPLPSCSVRVAKLTPDEIENYLKPKSTSTSSSTGKRKLPLAEAGNNSNHQNELFDEGAATPPKPKKPRSHSLLKNSDWWSSRRSKRRRSRVRSAPARQKQSTSKSSKPTWSPLECLFCGKVCSSKVNIEYHIRTHTEERPYDCKFCTRAFFSYPVLWLHTKTKHRNKKPGQRPRLSRPRRPRKVVAPPPPPPAEDTEDDDDDLFTPERVRVNLSLSENYRVKNEQIYQICQVKLERVPPLDLWEKTTSALKLSWKDKRKCPFCYRVFPTKLAIQLHIGKIHTRQDQMRLRCPVKPCKRGFTFRWEVKQHVEKYHPSHQPTSPPPMRKRKPKAKVDVEPPTHTQASTSTTTSAKKASAVGASGTLKCSKCPKSFNALWQLNRHTKTCQNLGLQTCPSRDCSKTFKSGDDKAVGDHLWKAHNLRDDRAFRCDICLRKFGKAHNLKRHRRQVHKIEVMPGGGGGRPSSKSCTSHITENPPLERQLHRCPNPQCKETFNTQKRLRLHLAVEHPGFKAPTPSSKSSSPIKIQTSLPPPPMRSPQKLFPLHSPPPPSPSLQLPSTSRISVPPPPQQSPVSPCPPEMLVVARKSLPPPLPPIPSTTVLPPPPPPSITDAQPPEISTLTSPGRGGREGGGRSHKEKKIKPDSKSSRKSLGSSPKTSICLFCGKDMKCYSSLEFHMNVHVKEKPYECSNCPKTFPYLSSLWQHEKRTHGEKKFPCDATDCSMTFATQSDLNNHQEARHPPVYVDTDPIAAEGIRLTFRLKLAWTLLKGAWRRRTNQAENVRQKVWDYWRQRRRWNLRMRMKMDGISRRFVRYWPVFGCHICPEMFRSRTQLNGHLRRDHPLTNLKDNKHYKCSQCKKCFFTMTEINRHQCRPRKRRCPKSKSGGGVLMIPPPRPPQVPPPPEVVDQGHPQPGQREQAGSDVTKEPQASMVVASGGECPEVACVQSSVSEFFRGFI